MYVHGIQRDGEGRGGVVRSKRGMCNNGGKMCRAYFSYLIAMAVPIENGREFSSLFRDDANAPRSLNYLSE